MNHGNDVGDDDVLNDNDINYDVGDFDIDDSINTDDYFDGCDTLDDGSGDIPDENY